jgi:uncharacterized protein (DUF1697 family)
MKYVALLRGIGPGNPNMHGSKLKGVLEGLGLKNVQPVISSGNVVFESDSKDIAKLEETIQAEWPKKLGFNSLTIIRSQEQLQALVAKDPYKGVEHSRESYQLVTFFKDEPKDLSSNPDYYDTAGVNALCSTVDTTASKTPDFMVKIDKQFGKDQITSRTWKTIHRILAKFEK